MKNGTASERMTLIGWAVGLLVAGALVMPPPAVANDELAREQGRRLGESWLDNRLDGDTRADVEKEIEDLVENAGSGNQAKLEGLEEGLNNAREHFRGPRNAQDAADNIRLLDLSKMVRKAIDGLPTTDETRAYRSRNRMRSRIDDWADSDPSDVDPYNRMNGDIQDAQARGDLDALKGARDGLEENRETLEARDKDAFDFWLTEVNDDIERLEQARAVEEARREAERAASLSEGERAVEDYADPADGDRAAAHDRFAEFVDTAIADNNVQRLKEIRDGLDGLWGQRDKQTADFGFWFTRVQDAMEAIDQAHLTADQISTLDAIDAAALDQFGDDRLWDTRLYRDERIVLYSTYQFKLDDLDNQAEIWERLKDPKDEASRAERAELDRMAEEQSKKIAKLDARAYAARNDPKFTVGTGLLGGTGVGGVAMTQVVRADVERSSTKERDELLEKSPILGKTVRTRSGALKPLWQVLSDPHASEREKSDATNQAIDQHIAFIKDQRQEIGGYTDWEHVAGLTLSESHRPLQGFVVTVLNQRFQVRSAGITMNNLIRVYDSHQEDVRLERQGANVFYMAIGTGLIILTGGTILVFGGAGGIAVAGILMGLSAVDVAVSRSEVTDARKAAARAQAEYTRLVNAVAAGGRVDAEALEGARRRNEEAQNNLWWAEGGFYLASAGWAVDVVDLGAESLRALRTLSRGSDSGGTVARAPRPGLRTDAPVELTPDEALSNWRLLTQRVFDVEDIKIVREFGFFRLSGTYKGIGFVGDIEFDPATKTLVATFGQTSRRVDQPLVMGRMGAVREMVVDDLAKTLGAEQVTIIAKNTQNPGWVSQMGDMGYEFIPNTRVPGAVSDDMRRTFRVGEGGATERGTIAEFQGAVTEAASQTGATTGSQVGRAANTTGRPAASGLTPRGAITGARSAARLGRAGRRLDNLVNDESETTGAGGGAGLQAGAGSSPSATPVGDAGDGAARPADQETAEWVLYIFRKDESGEGIISNPVIRDENGDAVAHVIGSPVVIPGSGQAFPIRTTPANANRAAGAVSRQLGADAVVTPDKSPEFQLRRTEAR